MSWQDAAACAGADPDLWFPEPGASTSEAKEVCRGCVVRAECLGYALANGEKFGVWGGLSERERRQIRRRRRRAGPRPDAPYAQLVYDADAVLGAEQRATAAAARTVRHQGATR